MRLFLFRHWVTVLFVFLAAVFLAWPEIDMKVAALFYFGDELGFKYEDGPVISFIYDLFRELPRYLVPALIVMLVITTMKRFDWQRHRKSILFLFVVLILGPGFIVHAVFKDTWDRSRPRHLQEFGGEWHFTPAFVVAHECEKNCSFVSGHAAMGFYWIALAWPLRKRRWLIPGLITGAIVGGVRIIQGGHFLSDVIFAGFFVYFSCQWVSYWIWGDSTIRRDVSLETKND